MLEIGQFAEFSKTISEYDVYGFAGITGDYNAVHINDLSAKNSIFKERIAHGMLVGSFISTVLGTKLPGPGTIYLEQNLKFIKPVYYGDTITARVILTEILNSEKGIYRFDTVITNQKNIVVTDGYAVVMYNE